MGIKPKMPIMKYKMMFDGANDCSCCIVDSTEYNISNEDAYIKLSDIKNLIAEYEISSGESFKTVYENLMNALKEI